jgi:Flp pilus assembly pilin Flp
MRQTHLPATHPVTAALAYVRAAVGAATRRAKFGERGAAAVDYALLIVLVVIVCFAAMEFFGNSNGSSIDSSASSIQTAGSSAVELGG